MILNRDTFTELNALVEKMRVDPKSFKSSLIPSQRLQIGDIFLTENEKGEAQIYLKYISTKDDYNSLNLITHAVRWLARDVEVLKVGNLNDFLPTVNELKSICEVGDKIL